MVENSIRSLLGEEKIIYSESKSVKNQSTEDATFVVRLIAKKLQMPTDNITIGEDILKKLDPVGVLRRLAHDW